MRSRFYKKTKPKGLMLTSLLDMFTIILIFLIVSFEAEDHEFSLNPDLSLPESSARSVFRPAVNMAINPLQILVEQKPILDMQDGRFKEEHYESGEVPEVVAELREHFDRLDGEQSEAESDDEAMIVTIQADKELDYQTIYLVMRSASLAGFSRYRLAIMKR